MSADALWQNGFGVIFPELEGESGFAEQRAILELIESLAPRLVIPGHGAPFTDVGGALKRAHARLDALSASLERNARHAAKVLVKFYLLEVRQVALQDLIAHVAGARYFRVINERYFRTAVRRLRAAAGDGTRCERCRRHRRRHRARFRRLTLSGSRFPTCCSRGRTCSRCTSRRSR